MHIVSRVGIGKTPPSSPLFLDVGGAVNFDNTLRVIGQTTVNALISSQLASNSLVYESRIEGELNILFSINRDGRLEWGSGGISVPDVDLYRSDINTLRTNGSFVIDQSLLVGNSVNDTATFTARIASDFTPSSTNLNNLGEDTLRWRTLWLSLKLTSVDGLFTGDLQVDGNTIIGNNSSNTLTVNAFVSSELTPSADNLYNLGSLINRWKSAFLGSDLQVDGNTILGDTTLDTLTVNALVSSQLTPFSNNTYDLGSLTNKWASAFFGSNLQVDGSAILGSDSSDTVTINAFIGSQVTPSTDNINDLGSLTNRWKSLFLGSDLQVDGNTILGDSPSDTVTINAGFASPMNPSVDNTYSFGTFDFRWKSINLGNEGVVIRNDNTDTQKASFYFNSGIAYLSTSPSTDLVITTNTNNGLLIDSAGKIGVNSVNPLVEDFSINGTSDFSDTAYFSKTTGYGLQVTSVAGIIGSIESANAQKQLNIGVNSETEMVNLGTGNLTKTINIGTGTGKTTINIGGPSDVINISGSVTTSQAIESFVKDKTFTLNTGGLNNTAQNSGFLVEEADSVFLSITDPTWQSANTVRYSAADTGNLQIGSIILISDFFNPENNGQFIVSAISVNSYIEIQNEKINDSSFDELGSGNCTNPSIAGKIILSSDRTGWELFSPFNYSNYFKLSNLGADAELKSTTDGLVVVSTALIPDTANTPLGSFTNPWNAILNDLTVDGNTEIGDSSLNLLTINSTTSFIGSIDSDFIPNALKKLGSQINPWEYVYANNLYSSTYSLFEGVIDLGSSSVDILNISASLGGNLIPSTTDLYDLGSFSNIWNNLHINSIYTPQFTTGSVLFIDSTKKIAESNSKLFFDEINNRLFLGQNTGSYILDISNNTADSIRLMNSLDSSAIAFRTDTTAVKIEYTNIIQFGSNAFADVGNGTSTPVLELSSNAIKLLGAVSVNSVAVSVSPYTVQPLDVIINIDTMSSGCEVFLPSAAVKRILVIKDIGNNASATNRSIQLSPVLNEYVEFNAINTPFVIERDGEAVTLQSDGNNRWFII